MFDGIANYSKEIQTQSYVVYDFETTGIDPQSDEIIEIGALKIENGKFTEVFTTLVKPKKLIPPDATKINRITNEMVANCYTIEQILNDFYLFCKDCQMVGYNSISFDSQFLINAAKRVGLNFSNGQLDVFLMAKEKLKGLRNYKLGTVAKYLEVNLIDAHRALNDVIATAEVFMKLY
ncbi:MAG: 3'-5' exonuclease [Clostridia bacterium]|nr:3'-5' exonuclease [Clostridia bacterium]